MGLDNSQSVDRACENEIAPQLQNQSTTFEPTYQHFLLGKKTFKQQYAHIYISRLLQLRPILLERVSKDLKEQKEEQNVTIHSAIVDLRETNLSSAQHEGVPQSVLIGTVLKDMPKKPCVLDEITEEKGIEVLDLHQDFTSKDDSLILEDETGRVALVVGEDSMFCPSSTGSMMVVDDESQEEKNPSLQVDQVVTGITLAVSGLLITEGPVQGFHVNQCWIPNVPPLTPSNNVPQSITRLNIGQTSLPFAAEYLMDYLNGNLGDEQFVSQIVRVIVAGNSINTSSSDSTKKTNHGTSKKNKAKNDLNERVMKIIQDVDALFSRCTIPIDLMPGETDPSNYTLPQQPLHSCLFPQSCVKKSFRCVPNPYSATVGGVAFLGSSGQPLDSMRQCSHLDSISSLEQSIRWRHMAPTAPDTLGCYPLSSSEDVFVMTSCPQVYFAGNQPAFQEKLIVTHPGTCYPHTRLVSIPKFDETHEIVALNLRDLSCKVLSIGI